MSLLAASRATIAKEPLTEAFWGELQPILEKHWQEVAHFKDLALNPHRPKYESIARNNALRIFTARDGAGKLVGYVVYFVTPSLHYAPHIFASDDILYIDPEHRGRRTGIDLIRFAHASLRADDHVTAVYHHTKHASALNLGAFLHRFFKGEWVDDVWTIRLDRD
jgi:hypothetical protein